MVGVSHADDGWDERPDDERLRRWPTVLALGVGLYVACLVASSRLIGDLRPGSWQVSAYAILGGLQNLTGLFLAVLGALRVEGIFRDRRRRARRWALLGRLATELAQISPLVGGDGPPGYHDPLRLATPTQLLGTDLLDARRDEPLVAALLALEGAAARYNDLVLTNALVLAAGADRALDPLARRYRAALDAAVARVRALLAEGPTDAPG